MRFLLKIFSWQGLLMLSILCLLASPVAGQEPAVDDFHSRHSTDAVEAKAFQSVHFAEASVGVNDGNYVVGRKRAISKALQEALRYALKSLLGEEEYASNSRELGGVVRDAEDYVKSYRILYAADNQVAQTSDIKLEATFFYNVLANTLSSQGLFSSNVKEKGILVLIRELSYTSSKPRPFWQLVPISETALSQKLIEAGANIIGRKLVQDSIPEETIMKALNGDMKVAAHIGLKAGADLVILGNAASSQRATSQEGEVSIQSNISLNVVSALSSALISARSEFAVAQNADPLVAEMEAFDIAAGQAVRYLWPSIQKVWNRELKEDVANPQSPATAPHSEPGRGDLPVELGEL
ncbi:MAG: hypothetical protein COV66_12200 [Nitrospinae bacterium CG11_big_fil_rev_8_21_14_0_20_45_15]|nr:MAG: hypothetical protein COV66_12200 [Nitrospinae bacterium CG11_big_fil_rev_8_21_14_0_20_45_15]